MTTLQAGSRLYEGRSDNVEYGDGGTEHQRTQEWATRSRDLCVPYGCVSCGAGIVGLVSYLFPLWRLRSCDSSVSSGQKSCMSQVREKRVTYSESVGARRNRPIRVRPTKCQSKRLCIGDLERLGIWGMMRRKRMRKKVRRREK